MGFGIASAIAGGLQTIGSIYAAEKSASTAKKLQKQQIDYNKEVAQNAHQWEVEDLKKAGLNPVLSTGGSGASANGISTPSVDTSGYSQAGGAMLNALSTAKTLMNDTQRVENETQQTEAQVEKTQADTNLTNLQSIEQMLNNKNLPEKQRRELELLKAKALESIENATYTAGAKTFQTNQDAWNKLHQDQKIDVEKDILKKDLETYELRMYGKGLAEAGKVLNLSSAGRAINKFVNKKR